MSENNIKATSNNNGADSPVCNGTLSPHYPASPALSPNNSMNGRLLNLTSLICGKRESLG